MVVYVRKGDFSNFLGSEIYLGKPMTIFESRSFLQNVKRVRENKQSTTLSHEVNMKDCLLSLHQTH